jgi:hypothetical protein
MLVIFIFAQVIVHNTALIEDEKRIEAILYEIADIMTKSTGARVAAYHFKGSSMKIETIIEFGLEAMKNNRK